MHASPLTLLRSSVSQNFSNEGTSKIIFHIPRNPQLWKRLQAEKVESGESNSFTSNILLRTRICKNVIIQQTNTGEENHSCEVNRPSDSQEILRTLWNPEAYYCIHRGQPSFPIQSTPRLFHFLKTEFNITLPFTSRSCKWSLSHRFPQQIHISNPPYLPHAPPIPFFLIWSPE